MSLVKKPDDDDPDPSNSKLVAKDTDETRPKRFVKVMDEDSYITKLESIIEKSFFPDLERLKVQKAYQEALRSNNLDALREIYSKYSNLLTPSTKNDTTRKIIETPNLTESKKSTLDRDEERPYANDELRPMSFKNTDGNQEESLDEFLAKNTSEDNLSFEMLMKDAEKKQRTKTHQAWLFEKEELHKLKAADSMLMIEAPKGSDDVTKSLDTWTYTSKNTLMFVPEGAPLTPEEELKLSKSVRKINHANTRFNARDVFAQPSVKKTSEPDQTASKLVAQVTKITKFGVDGKESTKETPKIGGYSLVDMTPSPMPGRSLGDESPAMMWGEIESTPFRLDPGSTPYTDSGPEFKIPSIPERERIALNLEEKASNERRKRKDEAMKQFQKFFMPSPKTGSASPSINDKMSNMSPAARRLLEAKLNVKTSGMIPSVATPSPARFSAASPSPRVSSPAVSSLKSPSVKISSQSIENLKMNLKRTAPTDSLTDNLLKLSKHS